MTQNNVSNYSQSEIDRAQKAVKMSAKIWLLLLCHILRWIIQFSMHNTPAGFVLLLLDFLHIQYILSEQTDMSCLFNNYKSRQFVFWNIFLFLIAKFRSHDSANIIKCFSCMLFVILRAPFSPRAPLRIHMISHTKVLRNFESSWSFIICIFLKSKAGSCSGKWNCRI